MGALGLLDRILGVARMVAKATRDVLQDNLEEWGRFARDEPFAAAEALDRIATELMAQRNGLHERRRVIRRRLLARARAYRLHAQDLRRRGRDEPCEGNPLRRPGT